MKLSITAILFAIFTNHVIASGDKQSGSVPNTLSKTISTLKPASTIHVAKEPVDGSTSVPNPQHTDSIEHTVVAKGVIQPEGSKVEVLASAPDAELSNKIRVLLEKGEYEELMGMVKGIKGERLDLFAKVLAALITSLEQIQGISKELTRSNSDVILPAFFVYGNGELLEGALSLGVGCNQSLEVDGSIAEYALQLALKTDNCTRFLDLNKVLSTKTWARYSRPLINGDIRKESLLFDNGVHLRRFLTSRDTLDTTHRSAFDAFLTDFLGRWFIPGLKDMDQAAKEFLGDVLGLPLQVPHALFMESIISGEVSDLSIFLDTVHREAIEEGLKVEGESVKLWNAIRRKFPGYPFPDQPSSEAVNVALSFFKTKREMEMEQRDGALEYLAPLLDIPSCLLPIILDYEPLLAVKRKIKTENQWFNDMLEEHSPLPAVLITSVPDLQHSNKTKHTSAAKRVAQPEGSKVEVFASVPDAELSGKIRTLLEKGKYEELVGMTRGIGGEKLDLFAKILATSITSPEQIRDISEWLIRANKFAILPAFFVYGNTELFEGALSLGVGRDEQLRKFEHSVAHSTFQLALKTDNFTKFLDLNTMLSPRISKKTYTCGVNGGFYKTGILFDDGVHLKRFLISRGTLDIAHQGAFDTFLTSFLETWFYPAIKGEDQAAIELLRDVLGLPLQVPHKLFMESITWGSVDNLDIFLDTIHREAIEEGLKMKDKGRDIILWNAIRREFPRRIFPEQPSSEAIGDILKLFKTKEEMEMERAEGISEYLAPLPGILPSHPLSIILGYEPLPAAKRKSKVKEQMVQ